MNEPHEDPYDDLRAYALERADETFILQHLVDAHAAQTANETTKPISVAFALMGLFLFLEMNYTGRNVQLAHMRMARHKKVWPVFSLPQDRGAITAAEVMSAEAGPARDAMIRTWCEAVWGTWKDSQSLVRTWVRSELNV